MFSLLAEPKTLLIGDTANLVAFGEGGKQERPTKLMQYFI